MAKKIVNERCPFRDECEKKCTYEMHEKDCGYYSANATDTNHIDDQWEDNFMPDELFERAKGELVYLPIEELFPHPDNPRKDLGDLEELAESIKVKGIMQNLTVVRGHEWTHEEYKAAAASYKEEPTEEKRDALNKRHSNEGYTVIIGHRRLGAAKLAGIDELPCVITEMSPQDQVATMLLENMQRSDLTVYEQAQGFQMMLDFGESIDTIAEKSGFSKTTVRRRVKLLDLDAEKFKKAEKRGATLFDYAELDKINDPELKNEVLDTIGTDNFKWSLKRAIEKEENETYLATVREKLSSFATETEDTSGLQYVGGYGTYNKSTDYEKPEDADDVKYFFTDRGGSYIYLYREYTDEENNAKAARKEIEDMIESTRDELEKLTTIAFECRKEFVDEITQTDIKKNLAEILAFWMFSQSLDTTRIDEADVLTELGLLTEENEDEELTYNYDDVLNIVTTKPELYLWKMICLFVNDSDDRGYYTYQTEHRNNQRLSDWYDFLVKLGYEMSDDEKALRDGTHKLFKKDESEES